MKIKFTLTHSGMTPVDLLATVDTATTVGDLAAHLCRTRPLAELIGHAPSRPTLYLAGEGAARTLDPGERITDSEFCSGMVVGVTSAAAGPVGADRSGPWAVVTITGGPCAGQEFHLRSRVGVIGRDPDCDVVLTDPLVSRRHARVSIGGLPEIEDLASANGLHVNGSPVIRAVVPSDAVVSLGDTELMIRLTGGDHAAAGAGATGGHIRSPRLDPRYEGRSFDAPEPPKRPDAHRFPLIAAIAPVLLGGVLYFVTRSVYSLVFVAFGPIMIIGSALESRFGNRAAFKKAVKQFRADLAELVSEVSAAAADEIAARDREYPALAECVDAVRRRTPLLWTRRPDDPGFAQLRLGVGRQPSRHTITVSKRRDLPRDLVAEVAAVVERFSTVEPVPVVAIPAEHGAIGVAGVRSTVLDAARALVIQAAALHSPAELTLVAVTSEQSSRDWDWLKWLPHTTSAHSPLAQRHLASTMEDGVALVSELEELLGQRRAKQVAPLPCIVVLVEDDTPVERSRLVDLADHGAAHGIHVLWLAADTTRLPAACRYFVNLGSGTAIGTAGLVHVGESIATLTVDLLDAGAASALARQMSPLVDVGARVDDSSDLPRTVSLFAVAKTPVLPTPARVLESWQANRSLVTGPSSPPTPVRSAGTLRAVIGRTASGPHVLDLREDGPHALVGGTTGSGKSELLQSWLLAMAAAHSPQRLTFMLIDYKGGSAFKELTLLPHTVGTFTDLDPHLVRRALDSLGAEMRAREQLFAEHKVKDLVEMERTGRADTPPSLVIVVDEFAALVKELPDFIDGMVNVAQRGRSLGIHLILATQRPAGVIRDNLRANTNLRVALRTADEHDSVDVLGSPQAAYFESAIPGRAVSKTGPGRLVPFQTGYVGGWTRDEPPAPEILVEELRFGARAVWEPVEADESAQDLGPTDIQRMVAAIHEAAQLAQIPLPRRPWLPELASVYNLGDPNQVRSARRDDELVFGIQDLPAHQRQPEVAFFPDEHGNLAVYGTGGSGKTTLLRTLTAAAGFTVRGGPCHVYGIDFGNGGLSMLEDLPHVGSIVAGTDFDRSARLLTWLAEIVAERGVRYARSGAGSITEYRTEQRAPDEARILLLVDGIAAFRHAYELGERARLFDAFVNVASAGRPVGVHVLITADRPASVPPALAATIQTRVVLRMADTIDYQSLGAPADVVRPTSPPGRGTLHGAELQVAILGERVDALGQQAAFRDFAAAMRSAGIRPAPPVARMPERVELGSLEPSHNGLPVLGLVAATLQPLTFRPDGAFLITGPPLSGRTSAMRATAVALRRWQPGMQLHLISALRRSTLAGLDIWATRSIGLDQSKQGAVELLDRIRAGGSHAVFIESVADFGASDADRPMQELVRACLAEDVFVVGEGESSTLMGTMGLVGSLKASRYGLALSPDPADGDRVFRTPFPVRLSRADFPPGRALFVHAGRTPVVGVGWIEEGG